MTPFHNPCSTTKGHARIKDTYANLPELTSLLDSGVADRKIEAEDLQLGINMILADEERIRDISAKLEQVQTLNKHVLDSEPIQNVPKFTERLNKLVEITIDQQGDAQVGGISLLSVCLSLTHTSHDSKAHINHIFTTPRKYTHSAHNATLTVSIPLLFLQLVTKDTEELLMRYNDIANSLTRQFVSWDVIVTKLELAGQTKEDDYL